MYKKIILSALTLFTLQSAIAQDDKEAEPIFQSHWKKGGNLSVNFNQLSFSNWAAGGENALALSTFGSFFMNYKTEQSNWDNSLDLGYGMIKIAKNNLRKNEDKIELNSKYGKLAKGKFFYSALLNFKSQFAPGYDLGGNEDSVVSRFLSPAFLTAALGMDYKPNDYFSLFLSPATGKYTFVTDPKLSAVGAYGVDSGKTFRPEFGALLNMKFQKDIFTNINLLTRLALFNNYTDKNKPNRDQIDVNWDMLLNMKINQYISANFFMNVIYDADIKIADENEPTKLGPKTQMKQSFGIGLSYKL